MLFLDDTAATTASGGWSSILVTVGYLAIIFVAMYLIVFRPQKKEQKRMAALLASMEEGDTVLTSSGFYGTVISIDGDTVIVEFGNNRNCRIPMQKSAITQIEKAETNA